MLPRFGYPPPRNRAERRALGAVPLILNGVSGHLNPDTGAWVPRMAGADGPAAAPPAQPAVMPALPFTGSAHEHTEPAFNYFYTLDADGDRPNPLQIPPSGYATHLLLEMTASGGAGGTMAADGPWSAIKEVVLQDTNGANIVRPLSGYQLYLANVLGGYAFVNDPALSPDHVGSAPNFKFFIRIPIQISERDALGALANQNAAAQYQVSLTFAGTADVFSVAPTSAPNVTVKAWLEAWTLPAAQDATGRPQAQVPPLLGTGQFWAATRQSVLSGAIEPLRVRQVGSYIRLIALVGRDVSGVRSNAVLPDPIRFTWDGNAIHEISLAALRFRLRERISGVFTYPTGLICLPFNHGGYMGKLGNETPDLWLATSESSRIEFTGNNTAAGSVEMLVNEVAPVETSQTERYQVPNDTSHR